MAPQALIRLAFWNSVYCTSTVAKGEAESFRQSVYSIHEFGNFINNRNGTDPFPSGLAIHDRSIYLALSTVHNLDVSQERR